MGRGGDNTKGTKFEPQRHRVHREKRKGSRFRVQGSGFGVDGDGRGSHR
jgi:hypothetical protein